MLFDLQSQELLELTHVSPIPKPKTDNKIEELLLKSDLFKVKIDQYKNMGITHVVIEEPLLNSNNVYTIGVLLRYNTLITKQIYDTLGVVPEFISTYNSRKFIFQNLFKKTIKINLFSLEVIQKTLIKK